MWVDASECGLASRGEVQPASYERIFANLLAPSRAQWGLVGIVSCRWVSSGVLPWTGDYDFRIRIRSATS